MLFILLFIIIVIIVVILAYNRLVRYKNNVESAWADVDVLLKKRYDLVGNLVETVKGYAAHEKGLFEKYGEARSSAMKATVPADRAKAENMMLETVRGLFAVAEAYPELKANTNFMELQVDLKKLEDSIELARRSYNAVVREYNIQTQSFPSNLVATWYAFLKAEFFELESPETERKPVKVDFQNK
jgi:LemA protein